MSPRYYRLDGHTPVPCSLEEWGAGCEGRYDGDDPWQVARDELPHEVLVSTVFLGLDHQWRDGPPLLFETMVFGLPDEEEPQWRCSTWTQAVAQHDQALAWAGDRAGP